MPKQPATLVNRSRWFVLVAVAVLTASGCRSTQLSPSELPPHLLAKPRTSVRQLHLAGFVPPGSGSDVLGPEDLLSVRLTSGFEDEPVEPNVLRVSSNGAVSVPHVGEVIVADVEADEAGRRIASAAIQRGVYRQPQVTVEVTERATNEVLVLGAVTEPGAHELPRGASDVISALAAAGGLTDEADPVVEVLRRPRPKFANAGEDNTLQLASFQPPSPPSQQNPPQPTATRINLAESASLTPDERRLGNRDVVVVHPRESEVIHVSGLVNKPDQFELLPGQNLYVLDALAMAGGRKSPLADRVLVIRRSTPESDPAVIAVSVAAAKRDNAENLLLSPGDLISVESSVATTLADITKSFFRLSLGVTSRFTTF